MKNCQETSRLLSEGLDRPPAWRDRLALRLHLLMCGGCRNFAKQLRYLRQWSSDLPDRTAQAEHLKLSATARQRIEEAIREATKKD